MEVSETIAKANRTKAKEIHGSRWRSSHRKLVNDCIAHMFPSLVFDRAEQGSAVH